MDRIETRTQLINFICNHIGQQAIVRACHCSEGAVQVMGGFSRIHPSPNPGWVVSITSAVGQTWLIAVTAHDHQHKFHAWPVKEIPWKYYVGKADGESIYDGDNPIQACRAKELAE